MAPPVSDVDPASAKPPTARPRAAEQPNRPALGAVYMTVAAILFALMGGLIKQLSVMDLAPTQIAFLRSVFAAATMAPILLGPLRRHGWSHLRPVRPWLMAFRAGTACCGVMLWVAGVTVLPLPDITAISFTAPLLATVGSALILKEIVRLRRWSAVIVGFLGMLIIVRPGMVPLEIGLLLAVGATLFMSMAAVLIKLLTRTETPDRIVFWTNIGLTLGTLIPALIVWVPMTWEHWLLGLALGAVGAISHVFLTRAFAVADATVVMPFDYARLPFAALVGWFAFGQTTDIYTWIGAAVIAASAIYVARREQQLATRAAGTAQPPA